MRPLREREETLLWGAGLVAIGAVFYLLVYSPTAHEGTTLATQLAAQHADIVRLGTDAQQQKAVEDEIADLQNASRTLEAKLPSAREIPRLLLQLDRLSGEAGVTVTSLKPGPLQPATAPAGGPAGPPRPGGRAATPTAPKAAQPKAAPYERFPIELAIRGNFPAIMKFVHGLEDFPRFLAISEMRVMPAPPKRGEDPDDPMLTVDVTATAYVRPENGGSP